MRIRSISFILPLFFSFFFLLTPDITYAQDIANIEKKALTKDTLVLIAMHKRVINLWHSHPDSLISVGNYMLKSSQKINYMPGEILALMNIGTGYYQLGKNKESVATLQKIIDQADKITNKVNLINALSNQSMAYTAMGMYDRSIDNLTKASRLCKEIGGQGQMLQILNNLGMVYNYKGNLDKALEYYEKCKEEMQIQKDSTNLSFVYGNIANILVSRGDYKQAKDYYYRGLKLAKHFKNEKGVGYALKSLGTVALQEQKYQEALDYFLEAKRIFEETGEQTEYLPLLEYLSDTYFALKDNKLGGAYLKQTFKLAQEQEQLYYIKNISLKLGNVFEKEGKLQEALAMQRLSIQASDSLSNKDTKEKIIRLEERYQFEKELEITDQAYRKAIDRKESFLTLMVFIALLGGIIAFMLMHAYFRQKRSNRLLSEAKEVIQNKNNMLVKEDQFKDHMISVLAHDVRSPIIAVRSLLDNLDSFKLDKQQFEELLVIARKEIASLSEFIDDILTWVKMRKNNFNTSHSRFDLTALINETVGIYKLKAAQKAINLKLDYPIQIYAMGNADIFKIILRNLLDNAIKYSGKDDTIRIQVIDDPSSNKLQLTIADQGPGLPPQILEAVLQQIDNQSLSSTAVIGAGLGLNICIYYAYLLNSKIEVYSTKEEGTRFILYIQKWEA